jgi:hypothetical protein
VPAFAVPGSVDNDAMATTIGINHRNFIRREYKMREAIAKSK